MKKILALVLAMMMVLTMGVAFAENNIEGAEYDDAYFEAKADEVDLVGHTFNAVQILKAEAMETENNANTYTNLSWGAQITDSGVALLAALKADTTLASDFTAFVTDTASVTEDNPLFTAAAFANAITRYTAANLEALIKVVKSLNLAGQTITIEDGMDPVKLNAGIGLYMIDDTTTGLENDVANASILTAVPGSNTIRIKVDKPSQDKEVKENVKATWNEVSDYSIGDYVPYKITSTVPNAEKFETYTMTFTDEMSTGLTFADTITDVADTYKLKVTVGTTELTGGYTLTTTDAQHFTVALPVKTADGQLFTAGDAITIEFYAQLNSNAEIGTDGNTNKSKLTYSNNPDDDEDTTDTPWDTVITFTYELDVNKVDGATKDALPGAQFALLATDGDHANKYVIVDANGKVTGWADEEPEPDATDNGALLVSDENGDFKVIGLDDGIYSLIEIKAPAGYNNIAPITVKIKGETQNGKDYTDDLKDIASDALKTLKIEVNGEEANGDIATGIVETTVENNSGAQLPETGGIGTTIFYVAGSILVLAAAILLVTKRRMGSDD